MTAGNNALASLAGFRDQFVIPDGVILPRRQFARRAAESGDHGGAAHGGAGMGQGLIRSWNTADWVNAPRRCGDKIARLIGADAGEVIACDSTSLNLFKALVTALQLQSLRPDAAGRNVIVSDIDNFPTDSHIAQGLQALLAERRLELRALSNATSLRPRLREVGVRTAVVMLTQVDYRSGGRYDMVAVTRSCSRTAR